VLREADELECTETVRIEQGVDRGTATERPQLLDWRVRSRRRLAYAEREQCVALRRVAREYEARALGGAADRGEVHARGEVVRAGLAVRIVDEPVAREAAERAGAKARQQLVLVTAVVDEDDVAAGERGGEAGDPPLRRGAHLPPATLREAFGHAPSEIGLAGRAERLRENAAV